MTRKRAPCCGFGVGGTAIDGCFVRGWRRSREALTRHAHSSRTASVTRASACTCGGFRISYASKGRASAARTRSGRQNTPIWTRVGGPRRSNDRAGGGGHVSRPPPSVLAKPWRTGSHGGRAPLVHRRRRRDRPAVLVADLARPVVAQAHRHELQRAAADTALSHSVLQACPRFPAMLPAFESIGRIEGN